MKKFLLLVLIAVSFGSCKKIVENKQNKMVVDAITSGEWQVTGYVKGGTDITTQFEGYHFKFDTDHSVKAYLQTSLLNTGTWQSNTDAVTMTTFFSTGTAPITLLNGTWKITATTWTSVDANQTVNGELLLLKLGKLP